MVAGDSSAIALVAIGVVGLLGMELREAGRRPAPEDLVRDDGSGIAFTLMCVSAIVISAVAAGFGLWPLQGGSAAVAVGAAVYVLGAALRLRASRVLGRLHHPVVTIAADHQVVCDGPYRFVRHPFYLGLLIGFAGLGLVFGTWPSLVAALTLPEIGAIRRIHVEERALRSSLGRQYTDYAGRTARLVPGLW